MTFYLNLFTNSILRGIGLFISVTTVFWLATLLTASQFGFFTTLIAYFAISASLAGAGSSIVIIRNTHPSTNPIDADQFLLFPLLVSLSITITLSLPLGVFIAQHEAQPIAYLIASSFVTVFCITNVTQNNARLRVLDYSVAGPLTETTLRPIFFIFFILLWIAISQGISTFSLIQIFMGSFILVFLIGISIILRHIDRLEFKTFRLKNILDYLNSLKKVALHDIIRSITNNIDVIIVALIISLEEVTDYKLHLQLGMFSLVFFGSINQLCQIYFNKLKDQLQLAKRILYKAQLIIIALNIIGSVFIFHTAEIILRYFVNEKFILNEILLFCILCCAVMKSMCGLNNSFLSIYKEDSKVLYDGIVCLSFIMITMILIVPNYGLVGAGISLVISYLIYLVLSCIRVLTFDDNVRFSA